MTVAAKMWRLETAPGYEPRVAFGPYENFQFGMKGQLHTRLAPDQAAKFVDDLKAGNVELQATLVFDGYTYQENTVVVYADDLLNSDLYKKLTGPGGKGFVGRHQVARIAREACLTRGVAVTTEYNDPDFSELVKNLVANFAKAESKPVADWDAAEKFFKDAGWDPNDFKADLIEAAKMNQNKEFRDTFSQEIEKAGGGSGGFSFGPFSIGGAGQSSEKNKLFKEVLDKWLISSEWNGKQYVAKSIDVYTLNAASIRQTSAFAVGQRKKTVSDGVLTAAVNPNDNVLHTNASPAFEEKMDELTRQLNVLSHTKLEAVIGSDQSILGTPELKEDNKDYKAETDGFVVADSSFSKHGIQLIVNNTPQGSPLSDSVVVGAVSALSVFAPVKKNETWKVRCYEPGGTGKTVENAATRVYWIPMSIPRSFEVQPKKEP